MRYWVNRAGEFRRHLNRDSSSHTERRTYDASGPLGKRFDAARNSLVATQRLKPLPPAVLIAGAEPLLVIEAADQVRAAAREQGFVEREVIDIAIRAGKGDGGESAGIDWADVRYGLHAMGLFSQRKLFEWRLSAPKLDKEGVAVLTDYLADANPDHRLLITAPEFNKKIGEAAWIKQIAAAGLVWPIYKLKPTELPNWLVQRARSLGLRLNPAGAAALAERTEGHLLAAAQDLSQLALLAPGATLGPTEIADAIADAAHFDVFRLSDAALLGDAAAVVRMLHAIRGEGEHPVALWYWIHDQLGLLTRMSEHIAAGAQREAVLKDYRFYEPRLSAARAALQRGGLVHWQARWVECAALDRILKGHALADPWLEMERLLLRVALPPAQGQAFAAMAEVA